MFNSDARASYVLEVSPFSKTSLKTRPPVTNDPFPSVVQDRAWLESPVHLVCSCKDCYQIKGNLPAARWVDSYYMTAVVLGSSSATDATGTKHLLYIWLFGQLIYNTPTKRVEKYYNLLKMWYTVVRIKKQSSLSLV